MNMQLAFRAAGFWPLREPPAKCLPSIPSACSRCPAGGEMGGDSSCNSASAEPAQTSPPGS